MLAIPPRLVFTTGIDPFQLFVNAGTLSRAGHVAIGVGDKLLHAYEPGVVIDSRADWLGRQKQKLVAEYDILPDVSSGVQLAFAQLGARYDRVGVVRAAASKLLRLTLSPLRLGGRPNGYYCAAFVMLVDPTGTQIPEWRGVDRGAVTPAELLGLAYGGPSFRRVC